MDFLHLQYLPTQPPNRQLLVRFGNGLFITTLYRDLSYGYYVGYVHTFAQFRTFERNQIEA